MFAQRQDRSIGRETVNADSNMLMRNLAAFAFLAAVASAHAQPSLIQAPPGDAAPAAFSPPLTLADSNASVGALMQAGVRPNPGLSLLQEDFCGTERTTTALVNQTIELGGKRRARLDVAAYGREAAVATLDEQGAAVRADVTSAFYGLLAAQRPLQVTEESAALAARSADLAGRHARAGKVSPVEVTKAQVAAAAVQIEVATARSRVEIAREKLNAATGSVRTEARVAVGDLEALPAVAPLAVLAEQLADAPLARAARAEMLRSNAAVSLEGAKRMPDVTVSAGMKRVVTGSGTGLGLAIVRSIMDNHGGEYGVDSEPGKRTTFWLRFPHRVAVAKPPRARRRARAPARAVRVRRGCPMRNRAGAMSAPGEIVVAVGLRRRVARMDRDAVKFLVARDACAAAMTQSSCPRHRCDARRDEDEVGHEPLPCGTRGIHAVRACAPESGRSCCHFNPDPQSESNRSSSFRHRSPDHSAARRMRIRGCRRTEGGCEGSGARRTGRLCGAPLRQSQFARQDASVRVSATPRGAMIAAVAAMQKKARTHRASGPNTWWCLAATPCVAWFRDGDHPHHCRS